MNQSGLVCNILRWEHDCTNGGMTSRHNGLQTVTLIRERGDALGPFEPQPGYPAIYLRMWKGRLIAVPEAIPCAQGGEARGLKGWMFGGNFIFTSDSRFPADAPIHVYDRKEG